MGGHFEFRNKMARRVFCEIPALFGISSTRQKGAYATPLLYMVSLLVFAVSSTHGGCEFPAQWAGVWFQNGIQKPLAVNSTYIDSKGECHEAHGDKFVLHDRVDGDCYRCIVIHAKHPSVLQYKETYCEQKASLNEMCDNISGDAPLFSMFRQEPPPKPQPCPFKGAPFTFSYNRGFGDCITPPSRAESCTDDSRLLLKYQACPDVQSTESNVEELLCLATWKEGSTRYLVGKISQLNRRTSDEDSYRCFIYKGIHHTGKVTYEIAQSGDATCNGVQSSTEGSRTMKLTTVDNHHNRCRFPSWITEHHTWHSLNHTRSYHFSLRNATLKISNEDSSRNEMRLVCHSILMQPPENNYIQLVAHITQGCLSGHVCMMFHKRDGGVIEVQHPDQRHESPEDACQNFDRIGTPYTTLITATLHPKPCPHLGRYSVYDSLAEKRKRRQQINSGEDQGATVPAVRECPMGVAYEALAVGCTGSQDTMEFKSSCSVSAYSCHGSWTENGVHYLIASPKSRASMDPRRYCFIYTISGTGNESHLSDYSGSRLNRARLSTLPLGRGGSPPSEPGTMRLSAVASSCSRTIQPGVQGNRAYNLTINGTCAQSSEFNSGSPSLGLSALLFSLLALAWTVGAVSSCPSVR